RQVRSLCYACTEGPRRWSMYLGLSSFHMRHGTLTRGHISIARLQAISSALPVAQHRFTAVLHVKVDVTLTYLALQASYSSIRRNFSFSAFSRDVTSSCEYAQMYTCLIVVGFSPLQLTKNSLTPLSMGRITSSSERPP